MTRTHPDDDRCIAYALAELDSDARADFEAHLVACTECGERIATLACILECEARATLPGAPVRVLVELLLRQARTRAGRTAWLAGWRRPVAAFAVVLAAMLFVGGSLQSRVGRPGDIVPSPRGAMASPRVPGGIAGSDATVSGDLALGRSAIVAWQQAALDSAIPDSL